ncbi:CPBP family intramembrane glutamic endopeptidase [Caulobacter hibisci]|uniref:CPBP family intramembrane metalloprotease n=1 Tax=Caulobacter hibisci TaxID=2035993 RepID=A0ABS0SSG6_9CAUL|nr:CPBP family intramembrane glutamic endopeptidase [Caulobacter hibisci]MBI1682577.1 CPBP family intramembrane metalloprotease [Caulobacter hibisci]
MIGGGVLGLALSGVGILAFDWIAGALAPEPAGGGWLAAVADAAPILQDALVLAGLALGLWLAAAWALRRRPLSFVTTAKHFRWPLLAAGFVPFALLQLAALGATVGFRAEHGAFVAYPSGLEAAAFCLAALAFGAPAVMAEEVLFRGWILSGDTSAGWRNLLLVLASSLVFCIAHLQSDGLLVALHFVSGAAYGWAVVRLGGLEFALGAHLAKNTVAAALLGAPGQHRWGGEFDAVVIASLAASACLFAVVEAVRAWRRL